ncbi:uncharacterized protein LOC116616786 [Nematostella vectensis]|uniref:uncharacterized protein LOC125565305 n=1 Tax=Nematostella vectensis TaxID=45351 RepID=UPI0020777114|nr:uncharacterized protein LOC125565305 [Nematostella vectensis]XP_048584348.1 uncharacterized protein LOC116616786 [Nematostella vectensis]
MVHLEVDLLGRSETYLRLVGIELAVVGFNYVITARTRPRVPGAGYILASIPERLILVDVLILCLLSQKLLPLSLCLTAIIIDTLFAILTFVIWYRITPNVSFSVFLKELSSPLFIRCLFNRSRGASSVVGAFGLLQFVYSIFFAIRPDFAREAFSLDPFEGHSAGYLGAFFVLSCESAWNQIYMGKARSVAFNILTVFSRLCFKLPVLVILVASGELEVGLGVFLILLDGAFAAITLMLLCLSGIQDEEPEDVIDAGETEAIMPKEPKAGATPTESENKKDPDFAEPQ